MLMTCWRSAALPALLAAAPFFASAAQAQMQTVTIRAYDSKGKDTGKCIRGVDDVSVGPGGYRLADCDKKASDQKFQFDVGAGGFLTQSIGASATGDGLAVMMAVLNGSSDNAWAPGVLVGRVGNSDANMFEAASKRWRWIGKQIANMDEVSGKWCLTTIPGQGKDIRIDKCSNTATLTQWDVLVVK